MSTISNTIMLPAAAIGGAGVATPGPIDITKLTWESLSIPATHEASIIAARTNPELQCFNLGHTPNTRQEKEGDDHFNSVLRANGNKPGTCAQFFCKGYTVYIKYYALDRSTWLIQYQCPRHDDSSFFLGGVELVSFANSTNE